MPTLRAQAQTPTSQPTSRPTSTVYTKGQINPDANRKYDTIGSRPVTSTTKSAPGFNEKV